jgi:MFS superfamily sulfate permease-like transporter
MAMNPTDPVFWGADWAWGLPLIVLTVVIHVLGLGFFNEKVVPPLSRSVQGVHSTGAFVVVMGVTVMVATVLLGLEAGVWAAAYRFLGALPDFRSAMLYSLSSMTTYGHANLFLQHRWQLMGALEALNGIMLLGLTTAFLFGVIQRAGPRGSGGWHREP